MMAPIHEPPLLVQVIVAGVVVGVTLGIFLRVMFMLWRIVCEDNRLERELERLARPPKPRPSPPPPPKYPPGTKHVVVHHERDVR